jgi:hypothetical protein
MLQLSHSDIFHLEGSSQSGRLDQVAQQTPLDREVKPMLLSFLAAPLFRKHELFLA